MNMLQSFLSDTEDADLVDLVFGGEDLDHLLLLSKKHLYKLTGVVLYCSLVDRTQKNCRVGKKQVRLSFWHFRPV